MKNKMYNVYLDATNGTLWHEDICARSKSEANKKARKSFGYGDYKELKFKRVYAKEWTKKDYAESAI